MQLIGQRFLWVDSLCFSSVAGSSERQTDLAAMAQIYADALVTLVSLGPDHESPIPGITQRRSLQACVSTFGGVLRLQPFLERVSITVSPHTRRGWVLQETLVSKRVAYALDAEILLLDASGCHGESGDSSRWTGDDLDEELTRSFVDLSLLACEGEGISFAPLKDTSKITVSGI